MSLAKTYRIETDRLVIRCYHPEDAQLLMSAIEKSMDHLRPWMPWINQEPESLEAKQERLRKNRGKFDLGEDYTFGIFNQSETELIGSTGLHTRAGENVREIGYWIGVDHIGKGYATESTRALMKVGFEIEGLDRIEIHCDTKNVESQKIPKKLGFTLEGILRNRPINDEGLSCDKMIWTMLRNEFFENDEKVTSIKAYDVMDKEISFPSIA